ncbi:hypothetical protein ACFQ7F_23745 [Streptomyces sp. NPDC056486]|uniref:hypothetical protein n=1 Tax=Streptomyces sp. NPDC056486 TaxID=3345835 RepID=UPI00368CFDAA
MHSDSAVPAVEKRAASRHGRRRKRGNGPAAGPVFVDTSGRRARLLRRAGVLAGIACLGYAVVLGMAFMGWGTSLSPTELLPFRGGGGGAGAGHDPAGGHRRGDPTGAPPSGDPAAPPADVGPADVGPSAAAPAN